MILITRSFAIVSLLFVAAVSALPTSTVVETEVGSVRELKRGEKYAEVLQDWKREAVSDWKREEKVSDWKRQSGSSRDWKREAGIV
ncbi:hypothetical protein C0991_008822 [Blastosporella zonata]|nr:hypothetical protein C0991_008822 [Blastosporella zonata]